MTIKFGHSIFNASVGYLSSKNLNSIIDNIYDTIYEVYDAIKNCSITSAKQALNSAYSSPAIKKAEILSAINHLRMAYNISEEALDKTYTKSSFFGLFTDVVEIVPWQYRKKYIESLYGLSDLITILYNDINEPGSARIWANYSYLKFKDYVDTYYRITPDDIKDTHPNLVHYKEVTYESEEEINHITGDTITVTETREELFFTEEGEAFVRRMKDRIIDNHIKELNRIRIV